MSTTLRIDATWAQQIAKLRDATTDDTNLIRFDNTHFRVARQQPTRVTISLQPSGGRLSDAVAMEMNTTDFYVSTVAGKPFGRYASTIDKLQPEAASLDNAIYALNTANGTKRFELQSLLVFCVAESIRSDWIATKLGQMIAASTGQLLGPPKSFDVGAMLPRARAWGQSSDAVWAAISPNARRIYAQPRAALNTADRQFSERVDEAKLDASLVQFVRGLKVLKRPNP